MPDPGGPDRTLVLDARGVLRHLGDEEHDWFGISYTDRVEVMGVCLPGLLESEELPEVAPACQVLALEGLAETFHVLPYPGGLLQQPNTLLEAFATIREARNAAEMRRWREMKLRAGKS